MIPVSVEIGPDTISDSELVFELDFRSGENVGSLQKKTLPGTGTVTKSFKSRSSSMRETPYYTKRMAMRQIENRQVNTHTVEDNDEVIILTKNLNPSTNTANASQTLDSNHATINSKSVGKVKLKRKTASEKAASRVLLKSSSSIRTGFEQGYEAEAILGAKDGQQGIFYLVKWKEREEMELIPAMITLSYVPSLVLLFYAKRIQWIQSSLSSPG